MFVCLSIRCRSNQPILVKLAVMIERIPVGRIDEVFMAISPGHGFQITFSTSLTIAE